MLPAGPAFQLPAFCRRKICNLVLGKHRAFRGDRLHTMDGCVSQHNKLRQRLQSQTVQYPLLLYVSLPRCECCAPNGCALQDFFEEESAHEISVLVSASW